MKVLVIVSCALFAAACGSSRPSTGGPVAAAPDASPPAPPVGAMARAAELLTGDWAVAGEQVPVVWLHPGGGGNAIYGAAAAIVPVVWAVDDTPPDVAVDGRHLEVFRYQGDQVRNCEEKQDGGEGLVFACEDGAGGFHFKMNAAALDIEEWTASSGPDTFHLVEADPAPAPALEEADRTFAADTAAKGAQGWLAWFADDAVVWQGATEVKGKAEREADIKATFEAIDLTWTPTVSRMLVPDALGVTAGVYTATPTDGSPASHGTYLTMWRKDPTGWRIVLDTGRPDK